MTDQYAEGMRRAAEIATLHDGADVTDCKDAGEGYDKAAFDICTAILAAIPAPAPWTPPDDRADGFECLGWRREGEWEPVKWLAYMDRWWWIFTDNATGQPTAFAPLPPVPLCKVCAGSMA